MNQAALFHQSINRLAIFPGDEDNGSVSSNPPSYHPNQNEALNLEVNPRIESNKNHDRKSHLDEMLGVTPTKRFLSEEVCLTLILTSHSPLFVFPTELSYERHLSFHTYEN